jgi:hypothetical protein
MTVRALSSRPSALDHLPHLFGALEAGGDRQALPARLRRLRPALFLD